MFVSSSFRRSPTTPAKITFLYSSDGDGHRRRWLGVCLTLDDSGTCTAAKVVLGAVGPTIINCEEAANALIGTKVDEAAIEAAGAAATAAATPIRQRGTVEYRKKIAGVLTRRAQQLPSNVRKVNLWLRYT